MLCSVCVIDFVLVGVLFCFCTSAVDVLFVYWCSVGVCLFVCFVFLLFVLCSCLGV